MTAPDGIDVSRYQGDVDWAKVRAAGVKVAVARASQGTGYVDPFFARNRAAMRAAGFRWRGFYHFGEVTKDARTQARHFLTTVGALQPGEFVVLDIESGKAGRVATRAWVAAFLAEATRIVGDGDRVWVYTGPGYWNDQAAFDPGHPLWVAHYTTAPVPRIPIGFPAGSALLWQFTSSAVVPGVRGRVDANELMVASLDAYSGLRAPAKPVEPVVPLPQPVREPVPATPETTAGDAMFLQTPEGYFLLHAGHLVLVDVDTAENGRSAGVPFFKVATAGAWAAIKSKFAA